MWKSNSVTSRTCVNRQRQVTCARSYNNNASLIMRGHRIREKGKETRAKVQFSKFCIENTFSYMCRWFWWHSINTCKGWLSGTKLLKYPSYEHEWTGMNLIGIMISRVNYMSRRVYDFVSVRFMEIDNFGKPTFPAELCSASFFIPNLRCSGI